MEGPKDIYVETQIHTNVGELGMGEGIGLGWCCRFSLNGLDV